MPTLGEFRQNYPQYNDMSDAELSDAVYKKWYSDMPRADFDKRMGAQKPGFMQKAGELATGLGVGVLKGAEAFPGAMANLMGMAGRGLESSPEPTATGELRAATRQPTVLERIGFIDPEEVKKREQFRKDYLFHPMTESLQAPASKPGQYGQSIGEFVPATVASPSGWLSRLSTAIFGGIGAQFSADLFAGDPNNPNDQANEPYARIIGGIVGSFLPTLLARTVNPLPTTQRNLQNINTL